MSLSPIKLTMYVNRKIYKGVIPYTLMTEIIFCECGYPIKGSSRTHAEANLKIHKASKLHRILIKNKEVKTNGTTAREISGSNRRTR